MNPIERSSISLNGLSLGDGFGSSLFAPEARAWVERRELPPALWPWTDETQMAISVVEELRRHGRIDQESLARLISQGYMADPARGYGVSTRQILERIAHGEYYRSAANSTFNGGSYGSSASARAVPIGGYFAGDPARAAREARLSAEITHTHIEGIAGAEAAAVAAALAAQEAPPQGVEFLKAVAGFVSQSRVREGILQAAEIPPGNLDLAIRQLGTGVLRTAPDTVPFALWCAAHHLDSFEDALWETASGWGSRDTNCAIVGGIVALSAQSLPQGWLRRCEPLPLSLEPNSSRQEALPSGQAAVGREGQSPLRANSEGQISFRTDPLVDLPNLLALLEWADHAQKGESFSLVAIQVVALWSVNRTRGRSAGDDLLRWCASTLSNQKAGPVYRVGGDKFAVLLFDASPAESARTAAALSKAIGGLESSHPLSPPRVAALHFSEKDRCTPGMALACLSVALSDRNFEDNDGSPRQFNVADIVSGDSYPWMVVDMASQMLRLGSTAEESFWLAQTDSVSQLPNMRAAFGAFERFLDRAIQGKEPLGILLIDGDNLRQYNKISYEAGDEAIRLLGNTLRLHLRESDFLARWRTGDEFLVLMQNTGQEAAIQIANRLCAAVEFASRKWLFPTTIAVGIAAYPEHGDSLKRLLEIAERGLDAAKQGGKNRVSALDG